MIRRIEALEMRVANAAHQDKVQRVVRRLEALELRLPSVDTADRLRNKREEELKMEVELLQETVRALRDQVKAMEAEMKAMGGILRNVRHLYPLALLPAKWVEIATTVEPPNNGHVWDP